MLAKREKEDGKAWRNDTSVARGVRFLDKGLAPRLKPPMPAPSARR